MKGFKGDDMDYVVIGYDNAGFITHVTRGEEWLCRSTAKQIRRNYKSVKVVDDDTADKLIELDLKNWIKTNREMNRAMSV